MLCETNNERNYDEDVNKSFAKFGVSLSLLAFQDNSVMMIMHLIINH